LPRLASNGDPPNLPISTSHVAGITGVSHCARLLSCVEMSRCLIFSYWILDLGPLGRAAVTVARPAARGLSVHRVSALGRREKEVCRSQKARPVFLGCPAGGDHARFRPGSKCFVNSIVPVWWLHVSPWSWHKQGPAVSPSVLGSSPGDRS
jgi:hypothetical protein